MKTARQWWIEQGQRLYMKLLHANFLKFRDFRSTNPLLDLTDFRQQYLDAATSVPKDVLSFWLNDTWRECLTAAWIIALSPDERFREKLTDLLMASKSCYQGQGLCIATARYRDERAAEDLIAYLNVYLPAGERAYDQEWAIGSLAWLDRQLGTNRTESFIDSTEAWNLVRANQVCGALKPDAGIEVVAEVMSYLDDLSVSLSVRLP